MNDERSNVRFLGSVSAGFPSPADDYKEPKLDLNELVVIHPLSTYFMRVAGDSMVGACIYDGDVVAIDRALTATHKKIVVARLGKALTLKRLFRGGNDNEKKDPAGHGFVRPHPGGQAMILPTATRLARSHGIAQVTPGYVPALGNGRRGGVLGAPRRSV